MSSCHCWSVWWKVFGWALFGPAVIVGALGVWVWRKVRTERPPQGAHENRFGKWCYCSDPEKHRHR